MKPQVIFHFFPIIFYGALSCNTWKPKKVCYEVVKLALRKNCYLYLKSCRMKVTTCICSMYLIFDHCISISNNIDLEPFSVSLKLRPYLEFILKIVIEIHLKSLKLLLRTINLQYYNRGWNLDLYVNSVLTYRETNVLVQCTGTDCQCKGPPMFPNITALTDIKNKHSLFENVSKIRK